MDAVVYDEITTQVGKKEDAASAVGSLHAKLNLIESLVDDLEARLTAARGGYLDQIPSKLPKTTSSAVYEPRSHESYTHFNISGGGYIVLLTGSSTGQEGYTIQVDGGPIMFVNCIQESIGTFIRFNSSLVVKATGVPSTEGLRSMVLLD